MSALAEARAAKAAADLDAAADVSLLIGDLIDVQSKRRIMDAWREGKIDFDTASELVASCGLKDVDECLPDEGRP